MNGEDLSTDDLIDVKTQRVVRPRPPTLTSIPSLLSVFQEEWDALALETYTLQQTLAQTRRELSAALYQHDAAVRVIARLTRERDEARDALSQVTVGASKASASGEAMQVDSATLPQAVLEVIENTQATYVTLDRKPCLPILHEFFQPDFLHSIAYRKLVESVQSLKIGLPLSRFPLTNLQRALSLFAQGAERSPCTQQASWPWSVAPMVLSASTLCHRKLYCTI